MQILCLPAKHGLCHSLLELAANAVSRLDLESQLARLVFCLDDITHDDWVWFNFGLREAAPQDSRRTLTIYLHPDHLLRDRPASTPLLLASQIWETRPEPEPPPAEPDERLFRPKVERFLYHQLLAVRDLCERRLDPGDIPAELAEAVQELWAISIDGRLRQQRLPGYSAAERRLRFSRVFARGGILLPVYWDLFHQLWEEAELDQALLVKLARRLPRLRR